jgi:glycosyltransferase involved in cell wall biosynthesis
MFDDAKPSWVKRNLLVQGIKNIITRQIDALWLPSVEYNKEYEKLYSNKKIHYLYGFNCVDNEWFKFGADKRFDNRKIICVGRLVPKKNIQNLLSAWKFVNQKNDTNSLVILGDGPLMPDLKDFVKSNNIGNVEFLGAVENDKIPQYLYMADAFISPSLYESWGLVVNEAMAAGLPVLLSDKINAAFTLLEEGINGYMFDPYNQEQMQQKLINYINLSESQKKEMSENSLRMISSMSYENMGRALLEVLDKLKNEGYRRPGLVALMAINSWSGRYNTFGWDNV